jgi:ubiquinone biosynthesis protein COQ9
MTETEILAEERARLLEAAIAHVPFDGWSLSALRAGAADLSLPELEAMNAFPGGAREMIEAFSQEIDRRMIQRLDEAHLHNLRVREKVALGVRTRLDLLEPYKEAVRHGMIFLALPHNAALGSRLVWRSVDAIWYAAGDTATDYNFYSKRMLLAGVYSSTLLYWLSDRSPAYGDTEAFLERRIDEVLRFGGSFGKRVRKVMDLPDRLVGTRMRATASAGRMKR